MQRVQRDSVHVLVWIVDTLGYFKGYTDGYILKIFPENILTYFSPLFFIVDCFPLSLVFFLFISRRIFDHTL